MQTADQREAQHQRDLLRHARPHPAQQHLVERIEPAQQRPAQQHGGIQGDVNLRQTRFGQGVIGRFLVVRQGHGVGIGQSGTALDGGGPHAAPGGRSART